MAVKIRLMRVGKKKQPTYRVVVADARAPRDGRFIEIIGHYGPRQEPSLVEIDDERALDWLRKGAQPTESVQKLLTIAGVWERYCSERGISAAPKERAPKAPKKEPTAAAGEPPAEEPASEATENSEGDE